MVRVFFVLAILVAVGLCPAIASADEPVEVVSNILVGGVDCCECGCEPCPECPDITPVSPVAVSTRLVESVGETSATLMGLLVGDGGGVCSVRFLYGASTSYGSNTLWEDGLRGNDSFSAELEGLLQGTVYHYRAQAGNTTVTVEGSDETFATPPGAVIAPGATPNVGSILLTWMKGTGATRTLVKRSTVSVPTTPTEGDLVYFGPDMSCNDANLESGVMYQYAVWSEANGVYSTTALTVATMPLAAELPSSTNWWGAIIGIGGIMAVIALYIVFRHRRPEPPPPSPTVLEADKEPSGKATSVSKLPKVSEKKETKEEVKEVAKKEEPEKASEEAPPGGSGFDEHAPPCAVCGSRITQLNEGSKTKYTCMKCGATFETPTESGDA